MARAPGKSPRPSSKRKVDRLIHGAASWSENQMRCDMAIAPFDRASREMDRKWGVDRLPDLVTPEMADRWGGAMAKLNAAIEADDPEDTIARVGVCLRGLKAMDAEATALGHRPSDPGIWEYEYDGLRFGIIEDGREWPAATAARPDLTIFSIHEVAVALAAWRDTRTMVEAVKREWPGARITQFVPDNDNPEDPIPF